MRRAGEPGILDREGNGLGPEVGGAFTRSDLDLDADRHRRVLVLSLHGECELGADQAEIIVAMAHPRLEHAADAVQQRPERTCGRAGQIDVFGVAQRLGQMQLVERAAAAKTQLVAQEGVSKQFDQRPADDEILLDLPELDPRGGLTPRDDVHHRNHSSSSGRRRTNTFQRVLRSSDAADLAGRWLGSSSTQGRGLDVCKWACSAAAAWGSFTKSNR